MVAEEQPRIETDDTVPRCRLKPEHVRPVLRALGKRFPRAEVCERQRRDLNVFLDELGLPPYNLLKGTGVF